MTMDSRFWLIPLLVLIVGLFVFECRRTRSYSIPERVFRFSKGIDRLLLFVPVLAAAVFAVLFLFVLKGRFYERLCHAMLVLAFWLYAARFYWFLISFFKNRLILVISIAAMIASAAAAILLTPLDRYAATIHSVLGRASIIVGAGMLAIFYIAALLRLRGSGNHG